MDATSPATPVKPKPAPLSPREAFSAAQRSWASSLMITSVGLVVIMGILLSQDDASSAAGPATAVAAEADESGSAMLVGNLLIGVAVAWLAILGPIVLVLRSYCFREPAVGGARPVEPGSYLKGMSSIWGVLTVGALLSLIGAAISGQVMPGGLVALVAVMLLGMVKPQRRALGLS